MFPLFCPRVLGEIGLLEQSKLRSLKLVRHALVLHGHIVIPADHQRNPRVTLQILVLTRAGVAVNDNLKLRSACKLDAATQYHIADCIRTHKGVIHGAEPATLEAKVVADADHLDKYGPVGVYQASLALNEFGFTINEIVRRFKRSRDLPMFTATAEKLARGRKQFSHEFEVAFVAAYEPYLGNEPEDLS